MPRFCSLFLFLGRFYGCLYAIFYRIDTKMRVCHKSQPIRPERAEAPSPGHRPGFLLPQTCRPVRAKALKLGD